MEAFLMLSPGDLRLNQRSAYVCRFASLVILFFTASLVVYSQGSGTASTGTGGQHAIQGHIYYPSGRRAEGSILVKLKSFVAGEITAVVDANGSFTFAALAPGSYTVVVNAGDDYEIATEGVVIDGDVNLSRLGIPTNSVSRKYTLMITLQPKSKERNKPAVLNAGLADVPENARKLYEKALERAQAKDLVKAIDDLNAAVAIYPKFPLALNELGVQYLRAGRAAEAVEPLRKASKLSPDSFTPKLNLGIALLEAKRIAEAEAQLRVALKLNQSASTAHMYLGLTLIQQQNYQEAEKELLLSIELSKDGLGLAHYYLGGIYWQQKEYRRAADELETYLRLTPNGTDAERVRATIKGLRAQQKRMIDVRQSN